MPQKQAKFRSVLHLEFDPQYETPYDALAEYLGGGDPVECFELVEVVEIADEQAASQQ